MTCNINLADALDQPATQIPLSSASHTATGSLDWIVHLSDAGHKKIETEEQSFLILAVICALLHSVVCVREDASARDDHPCRSV